MLGEFYDFAARRARGAARRPPRPPTDSSAINLWPEHFDLAFESGPEALGRRATYGASPGDEQHAEPYLYVGPWQDQGGGELWNATGFGGAELDYAELVAAEDPDGLAARFFTVHREALAD